MRTWLRLLIVISSILLLGLAGSFLWLRGGRPLRTGEVRLAGLTAPVEVRWDRWGVPAVKAGSEADLAAALGYLHANDRITQMVLGRRAAFGRLSELAGEATLDTDLYFRTLRFAETAAAMTASAAPRTRVWLEAYAAGVNAWLAERGASGLPPELRLLGLEPEPWEPVHSVAFGLLMARDLSFWNDRPEERRFTWLRTLGPEALAELLGDADLHVADATLALAGASGAGAVPATAPTPAEPGAPGSNNWAVAPERTAAGRAIVANDPHLGFTLPCVWYQVHLRAPGFEAAGMTLPGAPAVVLGRGAHLAWAFTNVMLDDHDLFLEELSEDGTRVRRGDGWLEITAEEALITVRGRDAPHRVTLRSTDLGPLLDADPERGLPPRSLAWTAYEGGDSLAALLELAGAASVDEVLAAISTYVVPAQNLVAALDSGELLYTLLGAAPLRRRGDGRLPVPAWDPSYGWEGLVDDALEPRVILPADGFLVTANHDLEELWAQKPPPPGPDGEPLRLDRVLTLDPYPGHRATRIREVLATRRDWDFEALGKLQNDWMSLYARELLTTLVDDYSGPAGEAFAVLRGWDGTIGRSGPSVLFELFDRRLKAETFHDEVPDLDGFTARQALVRLVRGGMSETWWDDVRTAERETRRDIVERALAGAWSEVSQRFGERLDRWRWDAVHQLTLRHRLDALPLLGRLLRRGPFPVGGSATTVNVFAHRWQGDRAEILHGASMRWITDWSQPDVAFAILPGGQSGHLMDPHYDDQVPAYLDGRLHLAAYSEERIEALTVARLHLQP